LAIALVLVVGWAGLVATFLTLHDPASFMGVNWLTPVLAGAVIAGLREGRRNRLKTLGLAATGGMAGNLLFLLVLVVAQYYRFNSAGFAHWWAVMGALLGAAGYGLTRLAPGPWQANRRPAGLPQVR
jgi:hypothetical protein